MRVKSHQKIIEKKEKIKFQIKRIRGKFVRLANTTGSAQFFCHFIEKRYITSPKNMSYNSRTRMT